MGIIVLIVLHNCFKMGYHIVIIGAGASGLMAAYSLIQKGCTVTILEARNRIGGRIDTMRDGRFSTFVEVGAEFIHGDQSLTFALVKQAGEKTTKLSGDMYQLKDGEIEKGDFFTDQWGVLMKALNQLDPDMDMASFLAKHFNDTRYTELREHVTRFVQGYDAADIHKVSALALRNEC